MGNKAQKQERSTVTDRLKALYKGATIDNAKSFEAYRMNRRNGAKRAAYFESCQRIGTLLEVFEILGISEDVINDVAEIDYVQPSCMFL